MGHSEERRADGQAPPASCPGRETKPRGFGRRLWRLLRGIDPVFTRRVMLEMGGPAIWRDRAVVLGFAALTGAVVVGFTLLAESATHAFRAIGVATPMGPWLALAWTPALTVLILWWTRRFVPGTAGSGIPQVVRALEDDLDGARLGWLVSPRVALHKVVLVSGGLLAGLSIGREGPTVQVGAGVMLGARRWLSGRSVIDEHDLMVAGAAAGIAAAFNTPLGGIVFALEQLSRRRGIAHSSIVIASIVLSGLIAVSVFGNDTYFGRLKVTQMTIDLLLPGLAVALVCGLTGGLFARLIVVSVRGTPDWFSRARVRHPFRFAAVCGLGVAVIGLVTGGATTGAGYQATRSLLEGNADLPFVYTLLKFGATWLSSWTGVPAGVFAPSLAIGAGIGNDVALAFGLSRESAIPLIAIGMAGFLSATTGGPITAFIIVMEMVAGNTMVLSLMAGALVASGIARLITESMYQELAALLVLPPESESDRAGRDRRSPC